MIEELQKHLTNIDNALPRVEDRQLRRFLNRQVDKMREILKQEVINLAASIDVDPSIDANVKRANEESKPRDR